MGEELDLKGPYEVNPATNEPIVREQEEETTTTA